ncbi:MAG TPA: transcription elongation factor GreA [bacterium]|nr:transcription elongation factor GreA [bacterium]
MEKNYMTRKSHAAVEEKLKHFREKELPAITREKMEAASQGDLSENAGYEYAKQKLEMIQNKILDLETQLHDVQYIEDLPIKGDIVSIGTRVTFQDLDAGGEVVYAILGPADTDHTANVISFKSPLARGMIAKKTGDTVTIKIPEGTRNLKVLKIERYFAKEQG